MITAEGIQKVNEAVKKIEIKGKNYVCVPARIAAFRQLCPEGTIQTEILRLEDGVVTMRASVLDESGKLLSTGFAQEKEASTFINKTSFIENCETSAVGRALGMIGIGSDEQMASSEEMVNALANQNGSGREKDKAAQKRQRSQYRREDAQKEAVPPAGQEPAEPPEVEKQAIDEIKVKALTDLLEERDIPVTLVYDLYHVSRLEDLTEEKHANIIQFIDRLEQRAKGGKQGTAG